MTPVIPVILFPDEGQLARLACQKVGKLIEGAVTIGLPAMVSGAGASWAKEFLGKQLDVLRAYVTVLHTVSGPTQQVLLLREASANILERLDQLRRAVLDIIEQGDTRAAVVQGLGPFVSSLFDSAEAYGVLIGLTADSFSRCREACDVTVRFLETVLPAQAVPV